MKIRSLLAGIAALSLLVMMTGCSILGFGSNPRDPSGSVTASDNVDAFQLRVGDCVVSAEMEESFSEVPVVPCNEPHDSEIVYLFDMPGTDFDDTAIEAAAKETCPEAMVDYAGPNWESISSKGLSVSFFSPTAESWKNGDHEVDCIAYTKSGDNELTYSLKDKGR